MELFDYEIVARFEGVGRTLLRPTVSDRDRAGVFDLTAWARLRATGIFDFAKDEGDTALRHRKISSALFGLAKGSLDLPFCASVAAHLAIGADLLTLFGTEAQRATYLPGILAGRSIGAICNAEPGSGSDLRQMKSRVEAVGDGKVVKLHAAKPCATNLAAAEYALVSAWHGKEIRVFLLQRGEFAQSPVQQDLFSFRTGAVGSLEARGVEVEVEARELKPGLAILRHCFHTERFYLGVLVAGTLAGLEQDASERIIGRPQIAERQYLQEKLVNFRRVRVSLAAHLDHIWMRSSGGEQWEGAATELGCLKMLLNEETPEAARRIFEGLGGEAVFLTDHAQRVARDLQALSYFGGTTELQKLQVFQSLAPKPGKFKQAA